MEELQSYLMTHREMIMCNGSLGPLVLAFNCWQ